MSTYVKSIHGFNFAGYSSVMVNLNENTNYLIGPNGAGKTILGLDILWFVMQGIAEVGRDGKIPLIGDRFRFIGKAGATALGEIVLHDDVRNQDIRVIRKLTKDTTELSFSGPVGMELDQKWLNELFNLFLIAPKKFIELSSREQSLALGIDTKVWDAEIARLKEKYTEINKEYLKLNKLPEVEKADRPPLDLLQAEKRTVKETLSNLQQQNKQHNDGLRNAWDGQKRAIDQAVISFNSAQTELNLKYNRCYDAVQILRGEGKEMGFFLTKADQEETVADCWNDLLQNFLDEIKAKMEPPMTAEYPPEPEYIEEIPDDKDLVAIDQKIVDAAGQNERALLYEQYLEHMKRKGELELQLQQNKNDQATQYGKMVEYIKAFKFPFSELSVDEEGGLLLRGKPLKPAYFSSGELISIIPTLFASRNPEFKYVFIQEANLMDQDHLAEIERSLVADGFQIVFEIVGMNKIPEKNCILLRNRNVVHDERMMLIPGKKSQQLTNSPADILIDAEEVPPTEPNE